MAFTGDALLIRACGRTDFQEGKDAWLTRVLILYIDLFAILKRINDLVMHCQNKMQGVLMTECPTEHDTVGIIVVISTHSR